MKIHDILREASDDSGDYQQMLAFTRANRVGGVPDEQQIPLALFKELKKQQQQNQALGRELSDAEKRIDQAMQSGELSRKELGMHRTELDRERAAGDEQRAAVSQLGQRYGERERASREQIEKLTGQLEQVRNRPGVDKKAADELEKKIKELDQKSVPLDRLAELESSIGAIQNAQSVDDAEIQDLMAQIEQAQKATQELQKTKQSVGRDVEKTAQATLDQVQLMRQDIEALRRVEKDLEQELNDLRDNYKETDASLLDIELQTLPTIKQDIDQLKTSGAIKHVPVPSAPQQPVRTPAPPQTQTPAPAATPNTTQEPANQPAWKVDKEAIFQKMKDAGHFQDQKVAEDQMNRAIAWATGKQP
jgi:chromosome segregation ATPase